MSRGCVVPRGVQCVCVFARGSSASSVARAVLQEELGHGRFSHVFACVHLISGQRFAVKVIDKETIEPVRCEREYRRRNDANRSICYSLFFISTARYPAREGAFAYRDRSFEAG